MIGRDRHRFKFLVSRADAARDERRFELAAALYEEALRLRPDHAGAHIQAGHMFKEACRFEQAEAHYDAARRLRPDDADLALQMGHFYKIGSRLEEAHAAYRRAVEIKPHWTAAAQELQAFETMQADAAASLRVLPTEPQQSSDQHGRPDPFDGLSASQVARLVPRLAPRPLDELLLSHGEEIAVRRLGRRETTFWGNRHTLRGVDGIRGFVSSETPITAVHVYLDGLRIHIGAIAGGYTFKLERDQERIKKYVFNLWIDFSRVSPGLHAIELRFLDAREGMRSFHDDVVVAEPIPEEAFPDSNFLVSLTPGDPRPLEEQIRSRPSMLRAAKRDLFPNGVHNVLVMRTDQLGDVVASVPALQRLRAMLPEAKIVGLFTAANADLARTLGLLDEIIVIEFPDDPIERKRLMPLARQEELRRRLEPYGFDIALDLAQAPVSRDLLYLAGAKFTYGTGGDDWPWLSSDFLFHTRDRWTRHDMTPHSTKVLGLIETLGTLLKTSAPILRRDDLPRSLLEEHGVGAGERYALLHTGARIAFSRWPFYAELARMFLAETDLKVVMMTEDPTFRATMPADLLADPRVVFLEQRLSFDLFDAFVSHATVMTGNDSGPKHLASLRGTNVVTIFSARINWTEWGQENVGAIISRKLPCAGCALLHDPEECGRGFVCITDIQAREVFDAMMAYVDPAVAVPA